MDFMEIALTRQSCRNYDTERPVEQEKLDAILEAGRVAPSACNGQPYHITVCRGQRAKKVAAATKELIFNRFADQAPLLLVISEAPYVETAAMGSELKGIDYRSIDIGILAAYMTAEAAVQGLGSCILGWINEDQIREICGLDSKVHLVITLGYPGPKFKHRPKTRKALSELVTYLDED